MGKKIAGKISKYADMPQRYVMGKAAEAAGIKKGKTSEDTARNIVERVAKRMKLGDSTAANAAKALGVAGLTVFADPVSLIPGGKIAKLGLKAASKTKTGAKAAKAISKNIDVAKGKATTDMLKAKPENTALRVTKNTVDAKLKKQGKKLSDLPKAEQETYAKIKKELGE